MVKILFLIHDLGEGGAEKVLINLVNNMDKTRFHITVMSLFSGGVNENSLSEEIRYITCFDKMFPGNSHLMKLFSPKQLHYMFIKEDYDIEISYLEGPCARIISGCNNHKTKLVAWTHCNYFSIRDLSRSYRRFSEVKKSYDRFHKVICVSQFMKENLCNWLPVRERCQVLYNTIESEEIIAKSSEEALEIVEDECINLIAVGSLKEIKGFDRLLRIMKKLKKEDYKIRLYILGRGSLEGMMKKYIEENQLLNEVKMLGYKKNPYKYVSKCDLFVCSSYSEGFSTAVTEAMIVGTAVCTVDVSGMREMLGDNNEYGVITENNEDALYQGIKSLLDDVESIKQYGIKAKNRSTMFRKDQTVWAVEDMLLNL